MVHCVLCSRDMKASSYQGHTCELPPTQEEMRSAAQILRRAASLSPEQPVVKICTGGAVHVYTCIYITALGYTLCVGDACLFVARLLQQHTNAQQLHDAFGITTDEEEDPATFPSCFCSCCKRTMVTRNTAAATGMPQRCSIVPFQWTTHTNENCVV